MSFGKYKLKPQGEILVHLPRTAKIKRLTIPSVSEDVGKLEYHTLRGACKMVRPLWKRVFLSLSKLRDTSRAIALLGVYPRKMKTCLHKELYKCV